MSAESENGKTAQLEKSEKDEKQSDSVENDKKNIVNKLEKTEETKLKDEEVKEDLKIEEKIENNKDSTVADKDSKDGKDVKDDKKDKNKKKSDTEDSGKEETIEEEEGDDEDVDDNKKGKKTSPKKKGLQRNSKDNKNDETGIELGDIPRIDASISRFKNDDLKLLHKLLFKSPIKTPLLKKNIRKFSGFSFKKSSDEYQKKIASMNQFEVKQLRVICEMLDLEKKGSRDEVSERILDFLVEPKDSGKPTGGGRPRRSAAVKANNRGYSDDEYSSDERASPRAKRNAGRRTNLKDETSTEESDEDFQPSEESEEDKPRAKRGRSGRRKKDDSEEEEESEVDSEDSDYSDEGPKTKQRKVANNKAKGRGGGTTRGRRGGRPAGAVVSKRKAPARRGRKKQETSEEEESEPHDEASSSEDEPLAKKSTKNPQPPTDDEIKTYVKEILDGANLEEITMKTVCKQVYAHYPDFDLTHKKDYIKNTVKSLIST